MAAPAAEPPQVTAETTYREALIRAVDVRTWGRANAARLRALQAHVRHVRAVKARCDVGGA